MADDEAHRPFFGSSIERLQGSPDLQMPPALAEAVTDHLEGLRTKYEAMDWAKQSGWGESAAVIVVDLALYWTRPSPMGSNVDSVVESSLEVIEAARRANLPVFFSTWDFDQDEDPRLASRKSGAMIYASADGRQDGQEGATPELMEIDPRLRRRASEKLFPKRYASCFKGTALARLCEQQRLPLGACAAFGDNHNDVEMLRAAGLGCAMANAKPAVKEAADLTLEWSDRDEGVARMCEQLHESGRLRQPPAEG